MFIIISPPSVETAFDGTNAELTNARALYYSKEIGTGRVYRSSYPTPDDFSFELFRFKDESEAQVLCDKINSAYNDTFKVEEIDY